MIAWLGVLFGLVLLRRRWAFVVPVLALLAIALLNTFFAITPRDNVRFMPFVFLYGAVGLVTALRWAATRVRASLCRGGARAADSAARPEALRPDPRGSCPRRTSPPAAASTKPFGPQT